MGPDAASLSRKGAQGSALVLVGSGASLGIQLAAVLILSRLLTPSDFGLIAMVSVFVALSNLLRDFGMPLAGLQEQKLSRQQASNLFWMSALIAATSGLALAVIAPGLVALFKEPRLALVVPVLALAVFAGGLTSQLQVQLARQMRFGSLVASDVIGQLVGLFVAIALAAAGCGYWALVAQTLVSAILTLIYRWVACRWVPRWPRRGHGSLRLFKAGATYGVAQLLTFAQNNVDTLVIGSQLGATSLGYYSRAYQLLTAPAGRLLDPLTQVVVTTLNRAKAEGRGTDPLLFRIQFGVGVVVVWVFAVTAGTAPGLIPLLLGDQWVPSVRVFQILAVGGSVWVFNHVSYWVFIVKELPRELLHYNLVSKPIAVFAILVGSQFGLTGVAWGYVIVMTASWPLNLLWLRRVARFPAGRFFVNGIRMLMAGAACAATGNAVGTIPFGATSIGVICGMLSGTVAFCGVLLMMPKTRALIADSLRVLRTVVHRERKERQYAHD